MSELFFNPITIIATILACFFILMALVRHMITKRGKKTRRATDKPYQINDPYAPPPAHPAPPPTRTPPNITLMDNNPHPAPKPKESRKFFRQFGLPPQTTGEESPEPSYYTWE